MLDLTIPLEIIGGLILLALLVAIAFTVRRYLLTREVGSFDCSLRPADARGWSVGIARYGPDHLSWYRVFALTTKPSLIFQRRSLELLGRRDLEPWERNSVMPNDVVVTCRHQGSEFNLALSADAFTGLSSWTEAAPPGQQWTTG